MTQLYSMQRRVLRLKIEPRSKARPRSFQGQTRPYMPKEYKAWMKDARAQLAEQWVDEPLDYVKWIGIRFYGPRRGDIDNLLGGIFDAGNGLVWTDDRVTNIDNVSIRHNKASTKDALIVIELIYP